MENTILYTGKNAVNCYKYTGKVHTCKDAGLARRKTNQGPRVVLDLVEDIKKY